ncbi:Major facilitator superfamily [Macrophomina phaseolina MS6]|uniref:Major facilitator superfamily n=1 Tax=Macrophomina phaseolina (strain MS6) TaxID=1126212 RepID=K2QW96_MACPH|nr:Major facilitator superfamily [Macrophomina phaseolina MS6]
MPKPEAQEDVERDAGSTTSSITSSTSAADETSQHIPIPGVSAALEKTETIHPTNSRQSFAERTHSHAQSVLSTVRSRRPVPPFSHRLAHAKTSDDVVVDFDGPDDPYRPLNWDNKKKIITTVLYGFTTMGATFSSSVYSAGTQQIADEFSVGRTVSTLGTSLLLFGFGIGPLLWAPLSEVYGRKPAVLAPYFISAVFAFGTATAKDIQTIMITRFFAGVFGSAPVTNTGGVLGDIWSAKERGVAIVGYAMAVVGGPTLGPIVGGAVVQTSYLGWRWTEYITGILQLFILGLDLIFLDESYPPKLLVYKARRLRHQTGNWALHARHEEWDVSLAELSRKYLVRPFQLLFTPICFLVALYASFVYGILYAQLAAFPIVFQEVRGWNQVVGALPFLALLVGILFGACANVLNQKYYFKKLQENGGKAVPEARLPPMMFGSVFFAGGLFIFAWTGSADVHWIAPVIGAASVGVGFFTIFQAALNYLIDTFKQYGASAIAANTFLRSCFAGSFPLFITPMLHSLGVGWGISIFGFIAIALIPIPYLFFTFGKRIRARGRFSRESTL